MEIYDFSKFTKRINEAKDDNLHQFVQYIKDFGKIGKLKHCATTAKNEFTKTKFIIDDFIGTFDNYSLSNLVYDYLYNNEELYDESGNEIEFDDIEDSRDPMSYINDMDDFNETMITNARTQIFSQLEQDERNMIYIEREIIIPKFINKDKCYDLMKNDYSGKLGVFWTYCKGNAEAQWSGYTNGDHITLYAHVSPEDVDWVQTIRANLDIPDEMELTLKDDATIELNSITTSKNNHTIFKGNLLYKA